MNNYPAPPLSLNLIPAPNWGKNVRAIVAGDTWDALRWHFVAASEPPEFLNRTALLVARRPLTSPPKCSICSVERKHLELHEEWEFDDEKRVQHLVQFQTLCTKCHLAKHFGWACQKGKGYQTLEHLSNVNKWTLEESEIYTAAALATWVTRSKLSYQLDFGFLFDLVRQSKVHPQWLDRPRTFVSSRLEAIVWAKEMLSADTVIIDTETTGLPKQYPSTEVIELAIVTSKGRKVFDELFRPLKRIPERVIRIHGITNSDVKGAPRLREHAEAIRRLLDGKTVISYNANFDRDVINRTFDFHGEEPPSCNWQCAMKTYRTFAQSGKFLKLPKAKHRALGDARATLNLIRKMARADF